MVSKGDLGIIYLVSVGVVLFGILSTGVTVPHLVTGPSIEYHSLLPVFSGLIIAGVFTATGLWLRRSELDDDMAWAVARWASVGLAVPVLLIFALSVWDPALLRAMDWRTLSTINIAFGGIIGVLSGSLVGLRTEYERKQTLYQRNTVFLRLFRHDIRNSVNLVRGHIDLLTEEHQLPSPSVDVIDEQLGRILRLGTAARNLDDLDSMELERPIDLSTIALDRVDSINDRHPEVAFDTDIRPQTYAVGNETLETVVENLLENPVVHHDGPLQIEVTLDRPVGDPRSVELSVRDDGPGFPEDELAVHERATETPLQHSDGVGLWLTRWIVEAHGGDVALGNAPDGGAVVTVTLPAASPADSTEP